MYKVVMDIDMAERHFLGVLDFLLEVRVPILIRGKNGMPLVALIRLPVQDK